MCPLATISKNSKVATVINVFTVEPQHQQTLADLLVRATEEVMSKLPGFVSASIHKSQDGTRAVNYAQWESRGAFEASLAHPDAIPHMQAAAQIARFDANLYEVYSAYRSTKVLREEMVDRLVC